MQVLIDAFKAYNLNTLTLPRVVLLYVDSKGHHVTCLPTHRGVIPTLSLPSTIRGLAFNTRHQPLYPRERVLIYIAEEAGSNSGPISIARKTSLRPGFDPQTV
jgi:hypothetical protein